MLAIIPARGGSKRLPGKNIKDFLGKPLLAWTIDVAKESGIFDRIVLSTDDPAIAEVGKKYGAEVPFMRPAELATDMSPVIEAIKYTLDRLQAEGDKPRDWFFLLEPTSPGRQASDLRAVAEVIQKDGGNFDSILGVSQISPNQTPIKALKLFPNNEIRRHTGALIRELAISRTQDIPDYYYSNSALYAFKTANLYEDPPSLWGNRVRAHCMDERYALDINTAEDWVLAEAKMRLILTSQS